MATMKFSEVKKMTKDERAKKLKELKFELIKSKASGAKTGSSRTKEIKRIIARIKTIKE